MSEETTKPTQKSGAGAGGASAAGEGTLHNFAELEQHFERIKKLHAQTAAREAELERLSAEVAKRTKELDARAAELDAWARQVDEERSGVEAQRREVDEARQELDRKRKELAAAAKQLEEGQQALEQGKQEAEELRAKLEALRTELDERVRSLDDREKAIVVNEERLAAQQKELEAARAALAQEKEKAAKDRESLDAEQRELAGTQQRLATMMKAVQARAAELEEREKAVIAREKGAQQTAAQVKEQDRAALEQIKRLEAAMAERAAQMSARDAEITKLKAELKAEADRHASEVAKLQAHAKAAAATAGKAGADAKGRAELEAELEKSRRAIELLADKLRVAQRETEQLKKRAGAQPAPAPEPRPRASADGRIKTDPHNLLRRARLQKYKALLQAQARKIMSAQAALTKRQAEAEQILAHRAKLAAAAEHVRAREAKLNAQRAKSAGAMLAFSFAATTAAMACIAWFAALQFAPATYLATATVEAEARGREKSHMDLEGWQAYHRDLVLDPQLMEQAAERVGRRGMSDLATGPALQAYLKDTLVVDSSRDGQLILTLKGNDAQRTATLLDTYVTALAAAANLSRTQRPDGLVTEISQPVAVPEEPVAHDRYTFAGAVFGAGMFVSLMVGGIGWQRVARARRRDSSDDAVDEALNEKGWPKVVRD